MILCPTLLSGCLRREYFRQKEGPVLRKPAREQNLSMGGHRRFGPLRTGNETAFTLRVGEFPASSWQKYLKPTRASGAGA
jgi:hypothetical protein